MKCEGCVYAVPTESENSAGLKPFVCHAPCDGCDECRTDRNIYLYQDSCPHYYPTVLARIANALERMAPMVIEGDDK